MNKIKQKIKELTVLQLEIDNNGGVEMNCEKYESYLEQRMKIVKHFGLPDNDSLEEIFYVKEPASDELIDEMFIKLKNKAESFLLAPAKSNKEILNMTRNNQLNAHELFMQLNLVAHIYTIFIFNEILLQGLDT